MSCLCLSGSLILPILGKFRNLNTRVSSDSYVRAQKVLPLLAELEDNLDEAVGSIGLTSVLMLARQINPDVPSAGRLRDWYTSFKKQLMEDPVFMYRVVDELPRIIARHDTLDFTEIIADKDFLSLLRR